MRGLSVGDKRSDPPGIAAGLVEVQAAIARLCTDAAAMESLRADPAGFAARHGHDVARLLGDVDLDRLQHFATSLVRKRATDARRLLPFTSRALGDRLAAEFSAFAAGVLPSGSRKPLADAMTFARHLQRPPVVDRSVGQAARFDWLSHNLAFRLKMSGRSPRRSLAIRRRGLWLRVACFDHEFPAISPAEAARALWPRRRTLVLFVSLFGRSSVWYWTLGRDQ